MDPFSEVLDTIHLKGAVHCHAMLRAPWGFKRQPSTAAEFIAVVEGSAFLTMEDLSRPLSIAEGDVIILPEGDSFTLRDGPGRSPRPLGELVETHPPNCPCHVELGGDGRETRLVAGGFSFEGPETNPLLQMLPPLLRVKGGQSNLTEWLYTTIELLEGESETARMGSALTTARLTEVLFIQALRRYFTEKSGRFTDGQELSRWLEAMTDRQIGRALAAVHQSPDDRWTVEKLAREALMSRTAFATRFTEVMGESPMQYVTRWRLHAASEVLRADASATVAEAARAAGYQSVSSFSKVFKREVGLPPGKFRETVHADKAVAAQRSQVNGKA